MLWHIVSCSFFWSVSDALLCYNCSTTSVEDSSYFSCAGDFAPPGSPFNSSRIFLVNCTGEGAMCFVRSWSERAQHSWLVQRGCYLPHRDDSLPHAMNLPSRAMTCRRDRLPDAEYKVCLCQADWCNISTKNIPFIDIYARTMYIYILVILFT